MAEFQPKFETLVDIYEHATESFASNPLFGVKREGRWQWMTYGQFREQVEAVRGALAHLGIGRGERVALISNNRPEWAVVAYAAYGLGASVVPMYESQMDKDWKYILKDCGARVLFVANRSILDRILAFREELSDLEHLVAFEGEVPEGEALHSFEELLKFGGAHPAPIVRPAPEDVAGFIYTSGTTGNPKGVLLTHRNLASNVSAIHELFPMSAEDRSLSFLPWAHSFGQIVELHGLFSMGASLGIAEAVDKIVQNLAEVRPTVLFSVPRIFNRIYDGLHKRMAEEGGLKKALFEAAIANEKRRRELVAEGRTCWSAEMKHKLFDRIVFSKVRERFGGRLRYAFSGGAAISKEVAEFIDSLGIMVYEGYGLTETSPIVTANYPGHRKIGSVGKPLPGVRVVIDKSVTGDERDGEIVVYGHNVMKGYHNLPEENAKVFTEDGGFRTGDMGRLDEDGYVYITGRVKEQYKLENGKYVVPTPLEEKLKLSPFVANVMVYGDNKPYNVALLVPDMEVLGKWAAEQGLDAGDPQKLLEDPKVKELYRDEIEKWSKDFKQYEKIRDFAFGLEDFTTDNGMLTPTLKLKRRGVMQRYGERLQALYEKRKAA